ncbi:MAG: helix-turn-helix domain-containing protein [Actinomycetota bacterium]
MADPCASADTPPQRQTEGSLERRALATPVEVADYLRVPLRTIYRWRYAGEGPPALRVGRHLRFRWSDVEEWLGTSGPSERALRTGRSRKDIGRRDNAPPRAGRPKAS